MSQYRRGLWQYPLFQIPLIFLGICLLGAMLFWLLGLGRPNVAVAIALDLSSSTYRLQEFNAPGTVMAQEVAAVNSYLEENNKLQRNPNNVQIFGFAGKQEGQPKIVAKVISLTKAFRTDGEAVRTELSQSMQDPQLPDSLQPEPEHDDLNEPTLQGVQALSSLQNHCHELLLVSDAGVEISPDLVIPEALKQNVKINAITFGEEVPDLSKTVNVTGGLYLPGEASNLQAFFTQRFFPRFNSNLKWLIFWLGGAWIALMWLLTLPLDKWIFQSLIKMPMNVSGLLAIGNAWFWSAATPFIVWRLWQSFGSSFSSSC